jgi:hypothetical protein
MSEAPGVQLNLFGIEAVTEDSAQPGPAINWALGREHACSVCGSEQGVLIIGTLDRRGRRFAFRCPRHVKVSPALRVVHIISHPVSPPENALLERLTRAVRMPANARVLAGTDEEGSRGDSTWFQAYPHRSHRVRALTRGEREAFQGGVAFRCSVYTCHCPASRAREPHEVPYRLYPCTWICGLPRRLTRNRLLPLRALRCRLLRRGAILASLRHGNSREKIRLARARMRRGDERT